MAILTACSERYGPCHVQPSLFIDATEVPFTIGPTNHVMNRIVVIKPFVKRQKNAEAVCEAAQGPTMRFVAVKSEDKQSSAMIVKVKFGRSPLQLHYAAHLLAGSP